MAGVRPVNFTGTFRLALDAKSKRVAIPSKWRLESGQDFYVTPNPNGNCLSVYTLDEHQKAFAKIDAAPNLSEAEKVAAKRVFGARTHTTFCDSQGRAVLDADQLAWAGITTKAVLTGRGSNFEIWSPEKWKDVESQSATKLEDVAKLVGL